LSELHSVPRTYGLILIIGGLLIFFPMLAFLLEQWSDTENGWSVIMFVLTVLALGMSITMLVVGTNIVWYHDPKDIEKTQEEIAESSEFYPKESSEDNEKN